MFNPWYPGSLSLNRVGRHALQNARHASEAGLAKGLCGGATALREGRPRETAGRPKASVAPGGIEQARRVRWLLPGREPAKLRPVAQLTLHTERLGLVPLADGHLEFEIELDSDPEVMRYITGRARSPDEVEQAHRRRLDAADEVPGLGFWAGFADDEFVGWWILQPPHGLDQPRVAGEADLGYRVLRRNWRRDTTASLAPIYAWQAARQWSGAARGRAGTARPRDPD